MNVTGRFSLLVLTVVVSSGLCGCRSDAAKSPTCGPLSDQFVNYCGNPVISPGPQGSWDAGALGSMTVLKVGDTYHMYYEAWGVRSEAEWDASEYTSLQIGHATSKDGLHWSKDPANPVIPKGGPGQWDADGTWDPFVLYEDGLYKMWYGGGQAVCDWGFAVSKDGVHFEKKGRLSHIGHVEDCHVVHDRATGRYYMYYWDRRHEPYGLFRAKSPDEMNFNFDNAEPVRIEGEKYPKMYKFTHVFQQNGKWHMFYSNFIRPGCKNCTVRYAVSDDGLHWKKVAGDLFKGQDAEVLKVKDDLYYVYYGPDGYFDQKDCNIRLAIFKGSLANPQTAE